MSREWKPGDVAIIPFGESERRAILDADGTWLVVGKANSRAYSINRPLVVIDPEDREQVERLHKALIAAIEQVPSPHIGRALYWNEALPTALAPALREFANPPPPKPPEPTGLGAVVEDADGRKWTRADDTDCVNPWHRNGSYDDVEWSNVAAVRVLSEGVTP